MIATTVSPRMNQRLRQQVLDRYSCICQKCFKKDRFFRIHYKEIPGLDELDNLIPVCFSCHARGGPRPDKRRLSLSEERKRKRAETLENTIPMKNEILLLSGQPIPSPVIIDKKEYDRRYYERNKDRLRARDRERYQNDPERRRYLSEYYNKHYRPTGLGRGRPATTTTSDSERKSRNEYNREWKRKNKEWIKEYRQQPERKQLEKETNTLYYQRNRERILARQREYARKYYQQHKEYYRTKDKERYQYNPERRRYLSEYYKGVYKDNPQKRVRKKEYSHEYYLKNRERMISMMKEHHRKNRESWNKYLREWDQKNRERVRIFNTFSNWRVKHRKNDHQEKYDSTYYQRNKERINAKNKELQRNNRERLNKYQREYIKRRRQEDKSYRERDNKRQREKYHRRKLIAAKVAVT
jgi:hypothetical protein